MRRIYLISGVVLLVLGIVLAGILMTASDYVAPTDVTLTQEAPWAFHGVPLEEGATLIVEFKSLKPGGRLNVGVLSEQTYNRAQAGEALVESDYLVTSQASEGRIEWTCDEDGLYYVVFITPTKVTSKDFVLTITEEDNFAYSEVELRVGAAFHAEYSCRNAGDEVRAVLVSEDWFNMFREGVDIPKSDLMADTSGNSGTLDWNAPVAGNYYLILRPTKEQWPVPLTLTITVSYVLEGSEWPLPFTYSMESKRSGPWYLGAIVAVIGVVVLALGLRRKAAPRAAPATAVPIPRERPTAELVPPTPPPPAQFCINCGTQIPADSKFCPRCAARQG